jgi:hypothetical protein
MLGFPLDGRLMIMEAKGIISSPSVVKIDCGGWGKC